MPRRALVVPFTGALVVVPFVRALIVVPVASSSSRDHLRPSSSSSTLVVLVSNSVCMSVCNSICRFYLCMCVLGPTAAMEREQAREWGAALEYSSGGLRACLVHAFTLPQLATMNLRRTCLVHDCRSTRVWFIAAFLVHLGYQHTPQFGRPISSPRFWRDYIIGGVRRHEPNGILHVYRHEPNGILHVYRRDCIIGGVRRHEPNEIRYSTRL